MRVNGNKEKEEKKKFARNDRCSITYFEKEKIKESKVF